MELSKDISNYGLELAMEFGPNFLKPIQGRLKTKFPELSMNALDKCNTSSFKTKNIGHDYVYKNWKGISDQESHEKVSKAFKIHMKTTFDWISDENLNRLFSQSCYFASK